MWIEASDNFGSVRMLLPTVRARIVGELGPDFLFTLPSRDLCSFWNASAPVELTAKHAREAKEDFDNEEYCLTSQVLIYSEAWPCTEVNIGG